MHQDPDRRTLRLDLWHLGRLLVIASAVIFVLGMGRELVIAQIGTETLLQDLRHFALDSERSLPAWYSSLLMVGCAVLLLCVARLTRQDGGRDVVRWSVLALIFMVMAIDEAVSFHEIFIEPLRNGLGTSGIFYFAWVIPGSIIVGLLGLYFLPFLFRLTARSAVLFAVSGAIYVGGALGFELIAGSLADAYGIESAPYLAAAVLEEGLEIAGLTVFFLSLTDHLARHWPAVDIGIVSRAQREAVRSRQATQPAA